MPQTSSDVAAVETPAGAGTDVLRRCLTREESERGRKETRPKNSHKGAKYGVVRMDVIEDSLHKNQL